MCEPGVAPTVAVDHLKPRTDLAPVIIVVAASTASNVSSIAFATCCSEVGAGGETGSGKDGSGDFVRDTSDALEVVPEALPISETLATAATAVVCVGQVLLPLLLLINSNLGQISLPSSLWLRRPLPLM